MQVTDELDVLIVGAGWAGMYMLHKARQIGLHAKVVEAGSDVGGTWYWNRYPGARCDVPSVEYSFSFSDEIQQEWTWSERFASQAEILRYAQFVADRLELRRDIVLDTRVASAVYDADACRWTLTTTSGDKLQARYLVMATGPLSVAKLPEVPGIDSFRGQTYHTGAWPHREVSFEGRRVAVIGTGSSGIQVIPVVAEVAEHLHVFQRTANYSIPCRNTPLDDETVREVKESYGELRRRARDTFNGTVREAGTRRAMDVSAEEREKAYATRWTEGGGGFLGAFTDLVVDPEANRTAADFVAARIRETVQDPAVAEKLVPKDLFIGTKRLCIDTNYFETYNRDNVTLVDVRAEPIEAIVPEGIRTSATTYEFDDIIFATGFDAMTGALLRMDIRGRDGVSLAERWAHGPSNYLGLSVHGFPNLFIIAGPGSPGVLSNVIVSIEQHVEWIGDLLSTLEARGARAIEADADSERSWVEHVNQVADTTLYPRTDSWYVGANVPGKPRVFMPYIGGVKAYRDLMQGVAAREYEGFVTT